MADARKALCRDCICESAQRINQNFSPLALVGIESASGGAWPVRSEVIFHSSFSIRHFPFVIFHSSFSICCLAGQIHENTNPITQSPTATTAHITIQNFQ